jgi:hypothetical protein
LEEAHRDVAEKSSELRRLKMGKPQPAVASSDTSSVLLQRLRGLEEVVKAQEEEIRSLKDVTGQPVIDSLEHKKSVASAPSKAAVGHQVHPSTVAFESSSPSTHLQQVRRLVEWEAGELQQHLSEAAQQLAQYCSIQLLPSQLLPPGSQDHPAGLMTGQLWSAQDADRVVSLLVKQVSDVRHLLAQKDGEMLALSYGSKGLEQQLREVTGQLMKKDMELQAAVLSEKTASRQLCAITQERDALRRALSVPATLHKPDSVSGKIISEQQVGQVSELHNLVSELQVQIESTQRDAAAAAASAGEQRLEAAAARSRADAAEARALQLEKEADGLALNVASLQVRSVSEHYALIP